MTRLLPYPVLALSLFAMWLLLNGLSAGHVLLGALVAVAASWAMRPLEPAKPRIGRWRTVPVLFWRVMVDIFRSNVAVVGVILSRDRSRRAGFVRIPLDMRDPTGLAVLACIITATPGTAWVEYHSGGSWLTIHVLDLVEEKVWIAHIKDYEKMLMEIFR